MEVVITGLYAILSLGWHILGLLGLFKVNELLGIAGLLYIFASWIKAYATNKLDQENKYKELKEKLIKEGTYKV